MKQGLGVTRFFLQLHAQSHLFVVKMFKVSMVRDMFIWFMSKSLSPAEVLRVRSMLPSKTRPAVRTCAGRERLWHVPHLRYCV